LPKEFKILILNATPLIYLCRIGRSDFFSIFKETKYTTPKVREEVIVKGKKLGAPDALVIEDLIEDNIIKIRKPKNEDFIETLSQIPGLHGAEIQVIALAKELGGIAILDDNVARKTAKIFNVEVHGTLYLLLRIYYRGIISKEEIKKIIDEMISLGWRLSLNEYLKVLKEIS
jgi:predicted nucleic acid-binding protein